MQNYKFSFKEWYHQKFIYLIVGYKMYLISIKNIFCVILINALNQQNSMKFKNSFFVFLGLNNRRFYEFEYGL